MSSKCITRQSDQCSPGSCSYSGEREGEEAGLRKRCTMRALCVCVLGVKMDRQLDHNQLTSLPSGVFNATSALTDL